MISVIMPVYNSEKYLEAALNSVLMQTGAELEIIAVDDCSSDSSRDILRRMSQADDRIKVYENERNMGVAEVRNRALTYARGEYLAFCDSDDVLPKGAYSALLSVIGDRDIAVGAYDNLHDDGRLDGVLPISKADRGSLFKTMFSVSCLWTKLIRTSFVRDNSLSFDPSMKIGEDVVFLANAVMCNPTYAVTDALVYYHCQHDTAVSRSLTHVYTLSAFELHIKCRRRVLAICSSLPEVRDYIYIDFTPFITDFLPLIAGDEERRAAFSLYREYLLEYDFESRQGLFEALTGVPYSDFLTMTADEYIECRNSTLPRERVLVEFENGMIGMKWIIKYFKAWLKYKFKRER